VATIETERLLLEAASAAFLEDFARLAADPAVMRYIGSGETLDREGSEKRFGQMLAHWAIHEFGTRFMIERETGACIGLVGLERARPEAVELAEEEVEIGWWLEPAAWGRGFATEGAAAVRDEAFEQVGLARIVARFQPVNVASGRIMEKLGMSHERDTVGRHGDVIRIYGLERAAWLELS
jgi:RimJ/RimL family protein N-acetyltransferase